MPKRRLTKPKSLPFRDVLRSCSEDTTSHLVDPDVEKTPAKRKRKK